MFGLSKEEVTKIVDKFFTINMESAKSKIFNDVMPQVEAKCEDVFEAVKAKYNEELAALVSSTNQDFDKCLAVLDSYMEEGKKSITSIKETLQAEKENLKSLGNWANHLIKREGQLEVLMTQIIDKGAEQHKLAQEMSTVKEDMLKLAHEVTMDLSPENAS